MEFSLAVLIGSIIGLIFLSAFFSGSETSLTSASKARIHTLARSGKKNAGIFEKIFKDKEQLICTILFANNLVNVLASALATKILIEITESEGIFYATIIAFVFIATHYMAANYVEEPAGFYPPYVEKSVVYPELYKKD